MKKLIVSLMALTLVFGAVVTVNAGDAKQELSFTPNLLIDFSLDGGNYEMSLDQNSQNQDNNHWEVEAGDIGFNAIGGWQNLKAYVDKVNNGRGSGQRKRALNAFEMKVGDGSYSHSWRDFEGWGTKYKLYRISSSWGSVSKTLSYRWNLGDFNPVDAGTTFTYDVVFLIE